MKAHFSLAVLVLLVVGCSQNKTGPAANASASGQVIPIANSDFEQGKGDDIPGWSQLQHAGPKSYDFRIDTDGAYQGHGSFHITRTKPQVYGTLSQTINVSHYAGHTLELSAMLKSRDAGAPGWKLMLNGNQADTLEYSPGLTGTNDWQRQTVKLKLPPNARDLTLGVTLLDAGEGWMDNAELKVVD
jgi:hypothetical protein